MEYTGLMMVGLGYVEEPKSFLVLGLGGGTVTRHLRRYYPQAQITSVELDPAVVEIAQSHFGFQPDAQSKVVVEDARRFLARTSETYDVIFLDAYHGDYIPFHLLTREFLELVRAHLRDGGAVVANTWSKQQLYERESATYAAVFEGFHSYLGRESTNRIVVATREPAASYSTLEKQFSTIQTRRPFGEVDLPALLHRHFDRDLSWPADTPLLTDDYAPVNFLVQGENR
jgi:spermidine synthase